MMYPAGRLPSVVRSGSAGVHGSGAGFVGCQPVQVASLKYN